MKNTLMTLLTAFALTAGTAAAQTSGRPDGPGAGAIDGRMQGSPEEMAKRQTERMTQELGLSADQVGRVQQITTARSKEMQTLRSQARDADNRDQMREQMQARRAKYDAQFKEVLTADQFAKYTTTEDNRMNRGGGPGGPGMDRPRPEGASMMDANVDKMKVKTEDGGKVKVKGDKMKEKVAN